MVSDCEPVIADNVSIIDRHMADSEPENPDLWTKDQVLMMMQETIETMPINSPRELSLRLSHIREYNKMRGFIETEPITPKTTNNIVIVSKEENEKLWRERLEKHQQIMNRD